MLGNLICYLYRYRNRLVRQILMLLTSNWSMELTNTHNVIFCYHLRGGSMFGCIHARALHIFGSGGVCHSGYNFIHFHAFFGKNSPKSLRCAGEFLDFPKQITHLIGGSKGGRQGRAPPLGVQILSFSCSFRQK